jgi:hypothetical protein
MAGKPAMESRDAKIFHVVLPDIDGGLRERRVSRETFENSTQLTTLEMDYRSGVCETAYC